MAARLLVPLAIPRFPLPAILAALALDAVDQSVFHAVGADPPGYQSYDKAFDVYYLTVAYTAMLRNWTDPTAFAIGRALFYWRLIGVAAFEVSDQRALLLIFPNTFEYFFIAYEVVRLRWDPSRLPRTWLIGAAAGIWILIKLPQEWWIHIAQLDFTDEITAHPWALAPMILAGALAVAGAMALWPRLPPRDWPPTFDVDAHVRRRRAAGLEAELAARSIWTWALLEKVVLISAIAVIFGHVVPGIRFGTTALILATALLVVANALVSQWRIRRGAHWATPLVQFGAMLAVNGGLVLGARLLLTGRGVLSFAVIDTLFFLALLSLMITLFDRYRAIGRLSLAGDPPAGAVVPCPAART